MENIRYNPEEMQRAASQFARQAVQLADLITQVHRDIDALQAVWQGPSAASFAGLMAQWHTDVNGIQQVLEDIAKQVSSTGIAAGGLEDEIRRGFQSY